MALHGLAGVGKTELAVQYAYLHKHQYAAIYWVDARNSETLDSSLLEITGRPELPSFSDIAGNRLRSDARLEILVRSLRLYLPKPWLLVVDNLDTKDSDPISAFCEFLSATAYVGNNTGHILITTRNIITVESWANTLKVESFTNEETVDLFLRLSHLEADKALEQQAREIVETLEGLPLSIELAAAHIREGFSDIPGFLKKYNISRRTVLRCIRENSEFKRSDKSDYRFYVRYLPLASTWNMSFQALRSEKGIARLGSHTFNLLTQLSARTGADDVMTMNLGVYKGAVLRRVTELGLESRAPNTVDDFFPLAVLERLSLIRRSYSGLIISFHPLIQSVIRPENLAAIRVPQLDSSFSVNTSMMLTIR